MDAPLAVANDPLATLPAL
jgi:hypothetical protein